LNPDFLHLQRIRVSIMSIKDLTREGEEIFFKRPPVRDAVVLELQSITDAVNSVSRDMKRRWDHIPWAQYGGMGRQPISDYLGADLQLVWDQVRSRLEVLLRAVEEILLEEEGRT
jgi:uncharacterized protein with HEPN domain